MPESMPFPAAIGKFTIEALLGSGGMGEVYQAYDPTLRRTVALKTVRPDIEDPSYLDRLFREAQAVARLQHPNIVTVFEAGSADGLVYMAMEHLRGENLAAALKRGDLGFEATIRIVMQILDALHYAHGEGVVHRDIKPSNVLRLPDGAIKLIDFGLARITCAEPLTVDGAFMGTPYYASPEQLKGEPIDGRADVYSTGALAYQLLTGRRAFDGDNPSAVIAKVLIDPPPPMRTSWAARFPDIERIVSRALEKSAGDRYATAEDMRNALAAFLASSRHRLASIEGEQAIDAQRLFREAPTRVVSEAAAEAASLPPDTLRQREAGEVRTTVLEHAPPEQPGPTAIAGYATGGPSRPASASSPAAPTPTTQSAPVPRDGAQPGRTVNRRRTIAVVIAAAAVLVVAMSRWTASNHGSVPIAPAAAADASPPSVSPAPPRDSGKEGPVVPAAAGGSGRTRAQPGDARKAAGEGSAPSMVNPAPTPAPAVSPPPGRTDTSPGAAEAASAKTMFVEGAARNAGLRYVIVQRQAEDLEAEVDPDTIFHSGDRVRFAFESSIDGYLYVVQQGSSGAWNVLFPHPTINGGTNGVRHNQKYTVPSNGWFRLDNPPGIERAFVFLSREPLESLPGFKQPVEQMESVGQSVVDDLKRSINPRDLVFERDPPANPGAPGSKRQSTFVVNRDELGKFVSATIQLVHQ